MSRSIYEGIYPLEDRSIPSVAKLYAKVFAGPPWNEVSRCSACERFSDTRPEDRARCTNDGCTGAYSLEAYPEMETTQYIQRELQKPQAEAVIQARIESVRLTIEQILAFGWGYLDTPEKLVNEKYSSDEMRSLLLSLLAKGPFFYVSEVGVSPKAQGKGIGKTITKRLVDVGKQRIGPVVLRTNENSPMRYIAEGLGMKPLIGLSTRIMDQENPERVIFTGGLYARE